ncbi:unnamed protein product [Ceutorhynchus assimilis]|uniref:Large ribosomal subunit protein bL34m n=1 Tax=Ceutorhynchus assimilis TaxID=467358 RepID=A0A9N9MU14_9CUCU|nr:unnamed protein product [Ceutorhynchus assimilis]
MSLVGRLFSGLLNTSKLGFRAQQSSNFHLLSSKMPQSEAPQKAGGLFNVTTRSVIRCHFPRPSEKKRVRRHGWQTRMSTPEGRRIIMNRILKGRWVLTH